MKVNKIFAGAVMTAAVGLAFNVQAADSTFPSVPGAAKYDTGQQDYQPQPTGPSVNNDAFKAQRAQCETEVPMGKASGDVCATAAAMLFGADIPDRFRDMPEDQRIKMALRLLERGVDSSNVARARAYDYYSRIGFLGLSSYADPYRASELLDMMVKSGYPGGVLRKIRGTTSIIAFTSSEAEKRESCATAKKMLDDGKLDAANANIAREITGSLICTNYEQQQAVK